MNNTNISSLDAAVSRHAREVLLRQKARVFWLTGLSGAGKSTLAHALQERLHSTGNLVYVLDGDAVRTGLTNNLGFSATDRYENIRRVSETAKLFVDAGIIVICSFVSPTNDLRALARSIVGEADFFEVYVNASLVECERRDVKGLYAKARRGEIKEFTGIDAPFDVPEFPAIEIKTGEQAISESVQQLEAFVRPHIALH